MNGATGYGEFADLDRLVERAEPKAWALATAGYAHQQAERYEEALADYDRALALDPEYAYAHVSRGRVHERLRRHEEALADLDSGAGAGSRAAFALSVRAGRAAGARRSRR